MNNLLVCTEQTFDPDLAVLPIMVAVWDDDPFHSTIIYQNDVLKNELGTWTGKSLFDLINTVSAGEGHKQLDQLVSEGSLVISGSINNRELKFHSRKGENHFQMAMSDNTEINLIRDKEQRTTLINSFLNIGSHELKTPLSGIMGLTDLLLMNETDPEKEELMKMIKDSANILNETVAKMLGMIYSDNQSEPAIEKPIGVNISDFIQDMIPTFEKHLAGYDFSPDNFDLQASHIVTIPTQHLRNIFTEVAINLRRNTPMENSISIETRDQDNGVHILVKNDCSGIPSDSLEKIFEPFYRHQDPMKHSSGYNYNQGGMGMGLAVIRKYINQAGGKIWFENSAGQIPEQNITVSMHILLPKQG